MKASTPINSNIETKLPNSTLKNEKVSIENVVDDENEWDMEILQAPKCPEVNVIRLVKTGTSDN